MNGQEQRRRGDAIRELEAGINQLEKNVERSYDEEAKERRRQDNLIVDLLDKRINEERTHRLKLAGEQRTYVDTQDLENARQLQTLQMRHVMMDGCSVWRRLYWLVTGVWL